METQDNFGIKIGNITIAVQRWSTHKNPVLVVYEKDKNTWTKVASFNNQETADWFCDVIKKLYMSLA